MAGTDAPAFWEPKAVGEPTRGLFSVAEVHEGIDPHLLMGAQYETIRCSTGELWDELCETGGATKTFGTTNLVVGEGAAVYDGIKCLTVGMDFDALQAELRDTLRPKAEFAAEALLQSMLTESLAGYPASSGVPGMIGVAEAILAKTYSSQGIIHLNHYTATLAKSQNLLIEPANGSDMVHTIAGTPVVIGRAYANDAPGSSSAAWVGATGHVSVLLGPVVEVTTSPNLANEVIAMVEQRFIVLAECVTTYLDGGA